MEVPVSREHRGLKLEAELDRVDTAIELAKANPVACRSFEHVEPLTLQRRDGVSDDPWSCIELSHGRGEEAPAGEDPSLHEGNVPITESVERRDPRLVGQARHDHLVDVDLACMLDGSELQLLFRAEMGEQATLAHGEVGGEPAQRQPLETLDARDRRCNLQDALLGGISARGLRWHRACIARTVVLWSLDTSDRSVVLFTEVATMPLVNVKLIEGVFNESQKRDIVRRLTDTMVEIEGEALRPVTWVIVEEVKSGDWGIAGNPLTTADVKALAAGQPVG